MKGIKELLSSITVMLLGVIGIVGGGQGGLVMTYICIPVSLALMFYGLLCDGGRRSKKDGESSPAEREPGSEEPGETGGDGTEKQGEDK